MDDFRSMVMQALSVYLARGRAALTELREGRWEAAHALLKRRKAAYHNFRAHDVAALKGGFDAKSDLEVKALVAVIAQVDGELAAALELARANAAEDLRGITRRRHALGSYRSSKGNRRLLETA